MKTEQPSREKLKSIHPIIQIPEVQVVFVDQIQTQETSEEKETHFILITSVGIFFVVKRNFPADMLCSKYFSYKELLSISVEENNLVLFETESSKIEFSHPNPAYIVKAASQICSTLFSDIPLKTSSEFQQVVANTSFAYESKSTLVDRFLSLSLHEITDDLIYQLSDFYNKTINSKGNIYVTPDVLNWPIINFLDTSVCMEHSPITLNIVRTSISTFIRIFQNALSNSNCIQKFGFICDTFFSLPKNVTFFNENNTFTTELLFKKCDLLHSDFKIFTHSLSQYKGHIKKLSISFCSINEANLKHLFSLLFETPCFTYLEELSLDNIKGIELLQVLLNQLMGSDNILRNKTLHKLSIDSCDVEVSSILPVITLFPNGLHKLSITNCNFLTPITAPVIKTFQEISFIDLSGCSVTTESLLSFFTIISQSEAQPKKLVLNNLRIRSNSFTSFYEQILLIKIRRLESFSWSSNSINDENYFQFFDFLKNQINISDLCLSDSITSSNKYLINKLQNTLNNLKLERFVMRSNDEFYFKQDELIPILNQFKEQKLLKGIDLIGQRLGNEGVKALDEILSECNIIAISFDNTGSDYETLKELLNKIIENKNVEFAHWPKEDMKRVIRFAPERSNEVQMLKEKFLKKFGNNKFVAEEFDGDAEKDSIEELTSVNTLRNTCNRIENSNENAEGEQSLEEILVKSVALRNENLIEEIMECVGTEFDAVETDPIVITFRKLNE